MIDGHPFNRTAWAPQTAAPAASDCRAIMSDLR